MDNFSYQIWKCICVYVVPINSSESLNDDGIMMEIIWCCCNRHCFTVRSGTLSCCFIPIYYANETRILSPVRTMKAGTEGGIIWVTLGFKALAFVCCLARSCKVGHAGAPPPRKMDGPLELCPGGLSGWLEITQLAHAEFHLNRCWHCQRAASSALYATLWAEWVTVRVPDVWRWQNRRRCY